MGHAHERGCEVCGDNVANRLDTYTTTEWPIVQCQSCDFVYLGRVPSYETLVEEYAWEVNHAKEAKRRKKMMAYRIDYATRWRLRIGKEQEKRRLLRALGDTGRVLDIGCGGAPRMPEGLTPYGIEVSAELARQAKPLFEARGGAVLFGPAIDMIEQFEPDFFDGVLMRSYLEHEARPRFVLEKLHSRMRRGAVALVKVPNYASANRYIMGRNWCGFRFPGHVNYFTHRSLRKLTESIGFTYRPERFNPFDDNLYAQLVRS